MKDSTIVGWLRDPSEPGTISYLYAPDELATAASPASLGSARGSPTAGGGVMPLPVAEFRVKRGQNCHECGQRIRIGHLARYNSANKVVHAKPSCPQEGVTHAPSDGRRD